MDPAASEMKRREGLATSWAKNVSLTVKRPFR
jgi:hypothetical protein